VTETVDRRILGAFVGIDAITGSSVVPAIPVVPDPEWIVAANHSGIYVIFDGPGLDSQTDQFLPSGTWPAPISFEVTLQDPNLRYLPRRATVQAPLAVPVSPTTPSGVFVPQPVSLYPSPAAAVGPNWAVIRASVTLSGTTPAQGLPWAYLQVVQTSNNAVLATGVTDSNGEALLAVIGLTVQPNTSGSGPVTTSVTPATVTAYFDPTSLNQPSGWISDPDDIASNLSNPALKSSSQTVQLSSGAEFPMSFQITV
jgi:hypothetical protein